MPGEKQAWISARQAVSRSLACSRCSSVSNGYSSTASSIARQTSHTAPIARRFSGDRTRKACAKLELRLMNS